MGESVPLWVYNYPTQTFCRVNKERKVNDQIVMTTEFWQKPSND